MLSVEEREPATGERQHTKPWYAAAPQGYGGTRHTLVYRITANRTVFGLVRVPFLSKPTTVIRATVAG